MEQGRPSITAQHVAAHRLGFERIAVAYGDPSADERLSGDVAGSLTGPRGERMAAYLQARTEFFDRAVVSAIASGVPQIVAAGAGYDGRSLRYAGAGVAWFELDHPDTQRDKRSRLERLGIDTAHVRFVAADFRRDDLSQRLVAAGVDPAKPALVVCEGVAAYLDDAVLERVLAALASAVGHASVLAISLSVGASSGTTPERRAHFEQHVASLGEPIRSTLTVDDATALFSRAGWERDATPAEDGGRRRYGLVTYVRAGHGRSVGPPASIL